MHSYRVMAKLPQMMFVGTYGRHSFWVAVETEKWNFAAMSLLVSQSYNLEKKVNAFL